MLPAREMFSEYMKDNLTESSMVTDSIYAFENDRSRLEAEEADDLSDEAIDQIYQSIAKGNKGKSRLIL
jgi:hypothetical protein